MCEIKKIRNLCLNTSVIWQESMEYADAKSKWKHELEHTQKCLLVAISKSFELELHFWGLEEYKGQKINSQVLSNWGV